MCVWSYPFVRLTHTLHMATFGAPPSILCFNILTIDNSNIRSPDHLSFVYGQIRCKLVWEETHSKNNIETPLDPLQFDHPFHCNLFSLPSDIPLNYVQHPLCSSSRCLDTLNDLQDWLCSFCEGDGWASEQGLVLESLVGSSTECSL